MRIATYNVNGINGRLPVLLRWLAEAAPDVVGLQELKTSDDRFPALELEKAGYRAIWHGQKSLNGVAILARGLDIVETRRGLPGDPDNSQSRYIEAAIGGMLIGNMYLPNGNPKPGSKFDYKLAWTDRLAAHAATLFAVKAPVVLMGDYNIIPTPSDVYKPERWIDDALFAPEARAQFAALLEAGWVDALAKKHPEKPPYTFWKYWRNSFERDAGMRIDHVLLNRPAARKLKAAGVDRTPRGWDKTSDHAPVWVKLG
ncbi:exodeoxyribonuclease III [Sphingomonas rhizophila]|uniref:Exodeoxyribonuclease III n=1 Tax=Sphingomonas rhizophila TaxID=2071607 RepID=A0A7G9SCM3_9SPHN|nr:exodeoxyribonuclease III [Sphingomonas rhizophila]QNN65598.1 exodeoxyribonuclease III [Sphingomonas rhizophila]